MGFVASLAVMLLRVAGWAEFYRVSNRIVSTILHVVQDELVLTSPASPTAPTADAPARIEGQAHCPHYEVYCWSLVPLIPLGHQKVAPKINPTTNAMMMSRT